jgi:hypothetical protein
LSRWLQEVINTLFFFDFPPCFDILGEKHYILSDKKLRQFIMGKVDKLTKMMCDKDNFVNG